MKDAASDVQSVTTSFSESYTVLKTAPEDTYFGAWIDWLFILVLSDLIFFSVQSVHERVGAVTSLAQ